MDASVADHIVKAADEVNYNWATYTRQNLITQVVTVSCIKFPMLFSQGDLR
jgi:hypothetical protein